MSRVNRLGYHVQPRDGSQFVKLFADAQFYGRKSSLVERACCTDREVPRLMSQLFESEIVVQIGDRHFRIPRDIFSGPGDSPNFFTLGFAVFFASPAEVFPGLDHDHLLRPPSIVPPSVPNRSGDVFAELLHILRGYPLRIQDGEHRAQLLRDCRYFHLRGLEQKLIPHDISFNPILQRSEIVVQLEDVRQSGVQFARDDPASSDIPSAGWVVYARPFVDDKPYDLIIEVGDEATTIDLDTMRAGFFGLAKSRLGSLFQVVANKMNLPTKAPLGLMMLGGLDKGEPSPSYSPLGAERIKVSIEEDTDLTVDGESVPYSRSSSDISEPPAKRQRMEDKGSWIVRAGQWRLRVQPNATGDGHEVVLVAVKLDAYTKQRQRNKTRGFLGPR